MPNLLLIKLFAVHFVADFIMQSRDMAKNKSSSLIWLGLHLTIQFTAFWIFTNWKFALANAAIHGIIDWNIWRIYKRTVYLRHRIMFPGKVAIMDFKYWEDSLFYIFIGLDQFLHGITLIILSNYL